MVKVPAARHPGLVRCVLIEERCEGISLAGSTVFRDLVRACIVNEESCGTN